jgi:hypothetical protein
MYASSSFSSYSSGVYSGCPSGSNSMINHAVPFFFFLVIPQMVIGLLKIHGVQIGDKRVMLLLVKMQIVD